MEERYLLTITYEDDATFELSGLTLEETLQIVLEEAAQQKVVWFKIKTI